MQREGWDREVDLAELPCKLIAEKTVSLLWDCLKEEARQIPTVLAFKIRNPGLFVTKVCKYI